MDSPREWVDDSATRSGSPLLAGKSILFFSVSYRPEHAGIGPYAAATAERLAEEGAEVAVVAGLPHYPAWRLAPEDRWCLRRDEKVGGLRIIRLRQLIPRQQTALSRFLYELSFFVHGALARRTWRTPDVVVAVTPSLAGAVLARMAARRYGVPLIVIVQDLVTAGAEQSGMKGGRSVSSALGKLEAWLLRGAQAVGLVHESFLTRSLQMGVDPQQVHIVPNWSLRDPHESLLGELPMLGWQDRYVVLHAGNMGFKQGLEVVVEAARLAHVRGEDDLLFVLMGDGNRRDALAQLVSGIPTIDIIDPVDDGEFPAFLAAADVLLVTQRAEVHDMSVPSKLTAYFTAGRPIVCSSSVDGGTAFEVRRSEAGIVVPAQDAEALLKEVLSLRANPAVAEKLGSAGQAYSRENLSPSEGLGRVVALVNSGLSASV
jgi:colanic acid biosynthesis glycosyl transferase WcaI